MGQKARLHLECRDTRCVSAKVDGRDATPVRCEDGNGKGAEADFIFLIAEGIPVAADVAKNEAEFVD